MATLTLRTFDRAFAVTEAEETRILTAGNDLLFPQTLTEWLAEQRQYERDGIGNGVGAALSGLCQGACEKVGIHPASKTFIVEG